MPPRLPNFFIVGAPKAGTTSLYYYLGQHPEIYISPIKEPHYFAAEMRAENFEPKLRRRIARETRGLAKFLSGPMREMRFGGLVADRENYLRLFANAGAERVLGEASACYLWSPTAAERIASEIPAARIIVLLRDPAERAFSQYLHGVANGEIRWSFREHIQRNLRHRSGQLAIHYPFLEFGLYYEQLRRYREHFGKNVWIGFHDDFLSRPLSVYLDICRFLGVEEFPANTELRYLEAQVPRTAAVGWLKRSGVWKSVAKMTPSGVRPFLRRALMRPAAPHGMDPVDRGYLVDFYREDIRKLESLLGRDFDAWLMPSGRAGALADANR
jgi:hypothetical protein